MDKYDWYWISVFGSSCTLFTNIFCRLIRKHLKNKFIIIGGQGVQDMDIVEKSNIFGETMKKQGLCDLYLAGEGEIVVKQVLSGRTKGPGINNTNSLQINDLDTLPYPNYSFYDLDRYDYLQKNKEVFIVGSRGCVRRCTYCDVARYWPKFRYRSGQNIADEMIKHYEEHGVNHFYFTDSLINGSMKAFNDMCESACTDGMLIRSHAPSTHLQVTHPTSGRSVDAKGGMLELKLAWSGHKEHYISNRLCNACTISFEKIETVLWISMSSTNSIPEGQNVSFLARSISNCTWFI